MSQVQWGLLGAGDVGSERRVRTLGVGAAVRTFNDLAVPGMGGVWFGKQLFLSVLGIALAECLRANNKRVQNIEVTNAVEALACWLALKSNGWSRDARIRGATKMRDQESLAFHKMRKPSFYVTQPMRQSTIQPLLALGFVDAPGERFNAFCCTQIGIDFLSVMCEDFARGRQSVLGLLTSWGLSTSDAPTCRDKLTMALSPLEAMPKAGCEFLRDRISLGNPIEATRRARALQWIQEVQLRNDVQVSWEKQSGCVDDEHWNDLHAGALFFQTRDAAIAVLDQVEVSIGNSVSQQLALGSPLNEIIAERCMTLRGCARAFIENRYDPSPEKAATAFCKECQESEDKRVIEHLVARDGRVLQKYGAAIVPGVAFRGVSTRGADRGRSSEEAGEEVSVKRSIGLPDGISDRVFRLFLLNLDMNGQLDRWLQQSSDSDVEGE